MFYSIELSSLRNSIQLSKFISIFIHSYRFDFIHETCKTEVLYGLFYGVCELYATDWQWCDFNIRYV